MPAKKMEAKSPSRAGCQLINAFESFMKIVKQEMTELVRSNAAIL